VDALDVPTADAILTDVELALGLRQQGEPTEPDSGGILDRRAGRQPVSRSSRQATARLAPDRRRVSATPVTTSITRNAATSIDAAALMLTVERHERGLHP